MNHVNAIRSNDEYQCSHCGKSWDIHEEAPDCKMTLVGFPINNTVDYFGIILTLPDWGNYIATDVDGSIFVYSIEPVLHADKWTPSHDNGCAYLHIANVNLHGLDWKETLREC